MEQNLKNRLVGIVVIFSLAVIFLPMILDGSGVRQRQVEVVIPPKPDIKPRVVLQQKVEAVEKEAQSIPEVTTAVVDENSRSEAQQANEKPAAEKAPVSKQEPEKTVDQPKPGGDSFVLQVGSFQDRSKALAERDRVRKSDIAAVFVEQFDLNGKTTYRVRLGPFVNRDRARVAQNKIKAKYNIDGIIIKYER